MSANLLNGTRRREKYYRRIWNEDSPCIARLNFTLAQFRPKDVAAYISAFKNLEKIVGSDSLAFAEAGEQVAMVLAKTDPEQGLRLLFKSQEMKRSF